MDTAVAARLARSLMNQHGLGHWAFEFDRAKVRAGICCHGQRVISLSEPLTRVHTEAVVRNTILHEIAHGLVGGGHGHDAVWRAKARSIGCDGKRCYDPKKVGTVEYLWVGTCSNGHTSGQHRAPLRVHSCPKCSRKFNFDHRFNWKKNGRKVPLSQMTVRYQKEFLSLEIRSQKISA